MTNLSKTYVETAQDWLDKNKSDFEGEPKILLDFAKYLDSFQVLDDKMQIIAMRKSREIDGEVLFGLANALGKEKTQEIIKKVYEKHRHTKA